MAVFKKAEMHIAKKFTGSFIPVSSQTQCLFKSLSKSFLDTQNVRFNSQNNNCVEISP